MCFPTISIYFIFRCNDSILVYIIDEMFELGLWATLIIALTFIISLFVDQLTIFISKDVVVLLLIFVIRVCTIPTRSIAIFFSFMCWFLSFVGFMLI